MVSDQVGRMICEVIGVVQVGYVYILLTSTGKLYVGSTNDLRRRLKEHFSGRGGRFTRVNKPVKVVYVEETTTPRKREYELKRLSRYQKLQLIEKYKTRTLQILKKVGWEVDQRETTKSS